MFRPIHGRAAPRIATIETIGDQARVAHQKESAIDTSTFRIGLSRLWATLLLTTAIVVVELIALPAQLALAATHPNLIPRDIVGLLAFLRLPLGPPDWLSAPEFRTPMLLIVLAPLRNFVHISPLHALLMMLGMWVIGPTTERRFGSLGMIGLFFLGGIVPTLLGQIALFVEPGSTLAIGLGGTRPGEWIAGAGSGIFALFGATLFDIIQRGESRSYFTPLIAPMLFYGAISYLVPGDWSQVNALGYASGALAAFVVSRLRSRQAQPIPIGTA